MSESDNFDARLFRLYRRLLAKDEEILQEAIDERPDPESMFKPYELPCLYCRMEFTYHTLGTKGRRDLCCSDYCSSHYGKKAEEEDWEECTLEGFD